MRVQKMFNKSFSGIDIRERDICLASVTYKKGKPLLQGLYHFAVDLDWYEAGRISDAQKLILFLKKHRRQKKQLAKKTHFSLPTKHVIVRKITSLPDLPEKALQKLIEFEIGESIHLPFEEAIYDFKKIGSITMDHIIEKDSFEQATDQMMNDDHLEPKSDVLLCATSKALSENMTDSLKQAGFKPLSAEIRATAIKRLIDSLHPTWLQETVVVVDINEHSLDLHLYTQGIPVFTRNIVMDKSSYNQNAASMLSMQEVAVTGEGTGSSDWNETAYMDDLLSEIERAQNFFRYSIGQRDQEFHKLILTGFYTPSIVETLSERLSYPVEKLDFSPILAPGFKDYSVLDGCSVAIGLALRGNEKLSHTKK
jgi:type IV pilus assembly protein PilM